MNQRKNTSLPSVNRSVTLVSPPPLDEFFAKFSLPKQSAEEFTVDDFIKKTGCSEAAAHRRLRQQVRVGCIIARKGMVNGRIGNLYSIKA